VRRVLTEETISLFIGQWLASHCWLLYIILMLSARSRKLDEALIRTSSLAGVGYTLNRDHAGVLRKVEGEPGVSASAPPSHAAREALAALQIASFPLVEKVLMGEAAYRHLYPGGGQKQTNCDVIGLLSTSRGVILGEGKGTKLLDSLQQLTASATALHNRGASGIVRSAILVTQLPLYLECPSGLATVSQARGQWKISEPHLTQQYAWAIAAANDLGLDPRYDYPIFGDKISGSMNGLGLAVSKTGDSSLYTNREWTGRELLPNWGPIRKLKLPATDRASVDLTFVS
jgi:hypothetical protein